VVWAQADGRLVASRVDPGAPLRAPVVVYEDLVGAPNEQPALAVALGRVGLVWRTDALCVDGVCRPLAASGVVFRPLDFGGAPLANATLLSAEGRPVDGLAVAGGDAFGVAWVDRAAPDAPAIFFRRVTADGEPLDALEVFRALSRADASPGVGLSTSALGWALAFTDRRRNEDPTLYVASLDRDGQRRGADLRVAQDPAGLAYARIAPADDRLVVLWRTGAGGLAADALSADGGRRVGPAAGLLGETEAAPFGSTVSDGRVLVLWSDTRSAPGRELRVQTAPLP
jgi:hypothetical protein